MSVYTLSHISYQTSLTDSVRRRYTIFGKKDIPELELPHLDGTFASRLIAPLSLRLCNNLGTDARVIQVTKVKNQYESATAPPLIFSSTSTASYWTPSTCLRSSPSHYPGRCGCAFEFSSILFARRGINRICQFGKCAENDKTFCIPRSCAGTFSLLA